VGGCVVFSIVGFVILCGILFEACKVFLPAGRTVW
jgi:hypothetical protein